MHNQFLQTIDEILFTNIDVTSAVLAFVLINLATTRSFQDKLRAEITRETRTEGGNLGEYLAKSDTLLNYASMESVRMSPAACKHSSIVSIAAIIAQALAAKFLTQNTGFTLPESAAEDKMIGGYLIPKGTPIIIDWKRLNTQSDVWGTDGQTFRPERFKELSQNQYRYSLLRFGLGPRKCLGKNMADVIIKLAMITVLDSYHLSGVVDGNVSLRKDRFTCTPQQVVNFSRRAE